MSEKIFLIDTTRCTACRGCQIACKQWNKLPGTKTHNWGSHQNPADLSFDTFKLVRFSEVVSEGRLSWYFFSDQCRHCVDPPCKEAADAYVSGAVVVDEGTGAVIFTEKTRELYESAFEDVRETCPYDIPRRDPVTGLVSKCTMCIERVQNGLIPACVKACPTGAMNFGGRDEIMTLAGKRLGLLKKKGCDKARLLDDGVRVVYLVADDPVLYHRFAAAPNHVGITRKLALRKLFRPASGLIAGMADRGGIERSGMVD